MTDSPTFVLMVGTCISNFVACCFQMKWNGPCLIFRHMCNLNVNELSCFISDISFITYDHRQRIIFSLFSIML